MMVPGDILVMYSSGVFLSSSPGWSWNGTVYTGGAPARPRFGTWLSSGAKYPLITPAKPNRVG